MITTDGTRLDRQFFIGKNHKTHKHDLRHTNKLIRQHCDFFFFLQISQILHQNSPPFNFKIPPKFYWKLIYSFDVTELKNNKMQNKKGFLLPYTIISILLLLQQKLCEFTKLVMDKFLILHMPGPIDKVIVIILHILKQTNSCFRTN